MLLVVTLLYFNSLIKIYSDHFIVRPFLNSDIVFVTYCGENNYLKTSIRITLLQHWNICIVLIVIKLPFCY